MTIKNYPACYKFTLQFEGGYVDHPSDPGGATNMGITIHTLSAYLGRPATKREVRNLDPNVAAEIYKRNYWKAVAGDQLPDGMDLVAFDGGVNSGPSRGAKWLQRALGVAADGKVGAKTIEAAANARDGIAVIQRACGKRMSFVRGLRTWSVFGKGWGRRITACEATAVAMYAKNPLVVKSEGERISGNAKKSGTAAGGSAAAGGGAGFADLDQLVQTGVIALAVLAVVLLVIKTIKDNMRATAYAEAAEVME